MILFKFINKIVISQGIKMGRESESQITKIEKQTKKYKCLAIFNGKLKYEYCDQFITFTNKHGIERVKEHLAMTKHERKVKTQTRQSTIKSSLQNPKNQFNLDLA